VDSWCERLAFIDPTRLTVVEKPGSATARLQVYPPDRPTAQKLLKHFGGTLRKIPQQQWLVHSQNRAPIQIGQRLVLATETEQAVRLQLQYPRRVVLQLPAGLAFGTGDHATTAMILETVARLPQMEHRRVLDIGTGSGVLALACRALGSWDITAFDYDPVAIRTARANEKLNFPRKKIRWTTQDLHDWQPSATYDLITANLFLETLVNHAPRIIAALSPGGLLFTSGLLASQADEAVTSFKLRGLKLVSTRRRKKWVMHTWTKM
jgi:ribosomal protein L11 methyltransferase